MRDWREDEEIWAQFSENRDWAGVVRVRQPPQILDELGDPITNLLLQRAVPRQYHDAQSFAWLRSSSTTYDYCAAASELKLWAMTGAAARHARAAAADIIVRHGSHLHSFRPTARARVLAITSELPWPLNTGGHIRTFHLMRAMARRFDLRVVTAVSHDDLESVSRFAAEGIVVVPALTASRRWISEAHRAATAALAGEPYVMFHRHNRPALRSVVRTALEQEPADLAYLDHLDPYALRPLFPDLPIIVDMHNRYSLLARRVAEEHRGLRGWYLRYQANLLETVERRAITDATAVMAVSLEEQRMFEQLGARTVTLVPNGVDCSSYAGLPLGRQPQPPVLLYLGALSWPPNAAAADFLARKILPEVRRVQPDTRLWLVGRNPSNAVRALEALPGVEVHANVPEVQTYLAGATVLVVPLEAGGGTRLKILEAFAAGLPVVSTAVGVEGIDVENGAHLLVAERDQFAAAVLDVFARPDAARDRAQAARALVIRKYDWTVIGAAACSAVNAALKT